MSDAPERLDGKPEAVPDGFAWITSDSYEPEGWLYPLDSWRTGADYVVENAVLACVNDRYANEGSAEDFAGSQWEAETPDGKHWRVTVSLDYNPNFYGTAEEIPGA